MDTRIPNLTCDKSTFQKIVRKCCVRSPVKQIYRHFEILWEGQLPVLLASLSVDMFMFRKVSDSANE